ncbi:ankyrin repeat domain-containing protein [Wolbachia endosymbiont (group A) of Bombylius major]|uniref:ankyrin repeat domain-containing protein n=1 Tax=Wolbachia endosymbiont (group A) of Bombylius major TaxID=2953988 RepID=UPI00222FD4DF|nr:ankyrin repeat domain-containing protein [Wolbachia endosymbiont (group A) of Bombylius major]
MFGSNFRSFVSEDAALQDQSSSKRLIKSWHGSEKQDFGDSGHGSDAEEEQNTNRATRSKFQLTQSLLSQVRADKNDADANSGKQAYKDLHRMDFLVINGQAIGNSFIKGLYDKYNQENDKRLFAKHVFTEMFKHANAQVPVDPIMEELIINCNQAGYDGSLLMQLFPIFLEHTLQLPDANDRKISIICNSQDSLNIQYCPNMPVKQQDTNIEICRLDAILEFTLKSQDGKVEYENGTVTLTIPEQLKTGRENLLDDINKYFKGADNAVVAGSPAEVDSDVDNSFDIIPKNFTFDRILNILNKAKNGDYTDLDEVMGDIKKEKDYIPINPDLKHLKAFCSQQLNLTAQTDHERVREVLIEKMYKGENGTVKGLVLLAIAASDMFTKRYAEKHKDVLFQQSDEDLDRLLIGAGKGCYIEFLLEHLEKELDSILSWRGIYEKLKRASSIGNQECVEAILDKFKDTESRDPAIKLLHYAVEKDDYDLVNSLIKNGADVNIQDRDDKTALHYAVSSYGDIQNVNKMVMLLVESGANIDIQDSDGKTALHYAAAASNKDEIVRLLFKEGANEEIKDKSGKTFLDMVASGTKSFLLSATTSSHEAPVNIDDEKKQAHAQPAEHVPEESAKLKAQPSNTQEQQEVSETPVPEQTDDIESLSTQDALVLQSKSATVLSIDGEDKQTPVQPVESESKGDQQGSPPLSPHSSASGDVEGTEASANAAVTTPEEARSLVSDGEHDKIMSKEHQDDALEKDLIDFSSDDGNSPLGDPVPTSTNEIPGQEDGTQTTTRQQEPNPIPIPTPAPTPQPTPALKPTLIPSVANNKSEQVNDTKTNGKLPNNPGNGSITATQNTQKSKWPTVATWTFAVAGILAGAAAPAAYFAFSVSLLTTGIIAGVGVCCLVAAVIIYCRNRPSSSLEGSNVEPVANGKLVEQQ